MQLEESLVTLMHDFFIFSLECCVKLAGRKHGLFALIKGISTPEEDEACLHHEKLFGWQITADHQEARMLV